MFLLTIIHILILALLTLYFYDCFVSRENPFEIGWSKSKLKFL